jgi:predicted nucleic acid-binding protein
MRSDKVIQSGVLLVAALFAGTIAAVCVIVWQQPKPIDFLSFWAAGKIAIGGNAPGMYDIAAHRAVERSVTEVGTLPFPYPPPFALIVAPFALLPFGAAFTAWLLVTGALYLTAARGWIRGRLALAQPAVLINGFVGQSAFLTCGLIFGGLRLLAARPILGGALLGALVIKPQLGLMLPVALIAGRRWRAIWGAVASSAVLAALSWLALGTKAWLAFFALLGTFGGFVAASRWPWHELASIFAFLRFFGVPTSTALAIHAAVALAAAFMVWHGWRENRDGKEALLAAATLLGPPYLLSYDAVLLALPVAWLLARRPAWSLGVWLLALIPVGANFGFYEFPNTIALAAVLSLISIYRSSNPITAR